ncbi:hypothetical protein LLR08_23060 [Rouxiella badensis]|nr:MULTISPECIES: hypothetical protein [Rouxiella]MCC3705422.1 hypothetical protein [Rouxiella badensis]
MAVSTGRFPLKQPFNDSKNSDSSAWLPAEAIRRATRQRAAHRANGA